MPTQFFTDGSDIFTVTTAGERTLAFLSGNDTLDVRGGTFTYGLMGAGDDRIVLRSGDALVYSETGADRFDVLGSGFEGHGGDDADEFNLYAGNNHSFVGDAGNDRFNFLSSSTNVLLHGGEGNDVFNAYNHGSAGRCTATPATTASSISAERR